MLCQELAELVNQVLLLLLIATATAATTATATTTTTPPPATTADAVPGAGRACESGRPTVCQQ